MNPNAQTPAAPPDEEQIFALVKDDVAKLLKDEIDAEMLPEKQRQLFRLGKSNAYNKGQTYIAPQLNKSTGSVSWGDVNIGGTSEKDGESAGAYDYNIDKTRSYGRKYTAVLGTRPFYYVKGTAKDPNSEADRHAARMADIGSELLDEAWGTHVRNIEVFAKQWESGNVYPYLAYSADAKTFGTFDKPQYDPKTVEISPAGYTCPQCGAKFEQPSVSQSADDAGNPVEVSQCPQCGAQVSDIHYQDAEHAEVPEYTGDVTYPHAGPKLTLCTGFTVTVPFGATAEDWDDTPILYEFECPKGRLLEFFGDDLRKYMNDDGELKSADEVGPLHQASEIARSTAASLRGVRTKEKNSDWTFSRYWIPPSYYEHISKPNTRAILKQRYPDGLKVSQVKGLTVKIEKESKAEHWPKPFSPEPGEYLYRDPMCWGILPIQDIVNDTYNLMVATIERGMPAHAMDPDVIDPEQLRSENRMLEIIWAKAGSGRRLEDGIATIPSADFPTGAMPLLQSFDEIIQHHTGLLPAAWGGQSGNKTASQADADLKQALMQLSVPGEFATAAWVDTKEKALKLWEKHATEPIQMAGHALDFDVLRGGNWYFKGEPGLPSTWAERQTRLDTMISQNPQMASGMALDNPINAAAMRDYLLPGFADIQIPGENQRDRQMEIIRQLLQQPANVGPDGSPQPAIQPDPLLDDPQTDGETIRQWLIDAPGMKEQKENPQGWQHVYTYLQAMKQMGMQMMAPPPGAPLQDGGPPPDNGAPPPQGGNGPQQGPPPQ